MAESFTPREPNPPINTINGPTASAVPTICRYFKPRGRAGVGAELADSEPRRVGTALVALPGQALLDQFFDHWVGNEEPISQPD
jgi:hypothetical protein